MFLRDTSAHATVNVEGQRQAATPSHKDEDRRTRTMARDALRSFGGMDVGWQGTLRTSVRYTRALRSSGT